MQDTRGKSLPTYLGTNDTPRPTATYLGTMGQAKRPQGVMAVSHLERPATVASAQSSANHDCESLTRSRQKQVLPWTKHRVSGHTTLQTESGGIQEMLENKGQGLRQWEKEMELNGRTS